MLKSSWLAASLVDYRVARGRVGFRFPLNGRGDCRFRLAQAAIVSNTLALKTRIVSAALGDRSQAGKSPGISLYTCIFCSIDATDSPV